MVEKGTHTFSEWTVTKEATTTAKGSKEKTCSACGYKEVEEISIIETTSPKTGDYNSIYMLLAFMGVSCLGIAGTIMKKKR